MKYRCVCGYTPEEWALPNVTWRDIMELHMVISHRVFDKFDDLLVLIEMDT